jgi:hypothetical protein
VVLGFRQDATLEGAVGSHATDHELCHTPLNGLNRMLHSRMLLGLTPPVRLEDSMRVMQQCNSLVFTFLPVPLQTMRV